MQCLKFETTLVLAWSYDEAAQYIQTLKAYENKTQTLLEGKPQQQASHLDQAVEVLASIRRVNKTDAKNLMGMYGSVEAVVTAPDFDEFL